MRIAVLDGALGQVVERKRIAVAARGFGQGQPWIVGRRA